MHGGQRPISPQVLTKLSRSPSLCHQCTPVVFLGLINTCGNRNASPSPPPPVDKSYAGVSGNKPCLLIVSARHHCAELNQLWWRQA